MPAEETMPLDGTDNEMACRQENVSFVLVRPYYLGNIGSAARALKNFGFQQLSLVEPPHNYKDAEARMMAVGAFDVLKAALVYDSLSQAAIDTAVLLARLWTPTIAKSAQHPGSGRSSRCCRSEKQDCRSLW